MSKDWTKAQSYGGLSLLNRRFLDGVYKHFNAYREQKGDSGSEHKVEWSRPENYFLPDMNDKMFRAILVDCVILNGEVNRMMGHGYPHGDPRNDYLSDEIPTRIAYLRHVLQDDMELATPQLANWRKGAIDIIQDALSNQEYMFEPLRPSNECNTKGEFDCAYAIHELIQHLSELPVWQEPQRSR